MVLLDGTDVTHDATITSSGITLTSTMANGSHTLEVISTDALGNADLKKTTFYVYGNGSVDVPVFDGKIHLSKGWNLVSVPKMLDNSSVNAVFNPAAIAKFTH